jgi:oxygen-independent coproporphyrinogen III oxidase
LEPQTVFFKQKELIRKELPPEETSTAMYEQALVTLEANGLQQYEISAFARNKAYSRHNVGYWTGRPFLGLGPSAFSYWKERRFRNMANLSKYLQLLKKDQSPIDFDEELDPLAKQRELLTIQLRLVEGVNLKAFQIDSETKNSLIRLENQGFLENRHDRIRLTRKGIFFYDTVAVELI